MFALPNQLHDNLWSLLQVGLGTRRLIEREDTDDYTLGAMIQRAYTNVALRMVWWQIGNKVNKVVKQTDAVTDLLAEVATQSISSTEYKTLRITDDRLRGQLTDLTTFFTPTGYWPSWVLRPITRYRDAIIRQQAVLERIFSENDLRATEIEGFRVISQDEAWTSRTTAYDYAS